MVQENLLHRTSRCKTKLAMYEVNLDSHISRIDLIGKDTIVLKEGKQITEFKENFALVNSESYCLSI